MILLFLPAKEFNFDQAFWNTTIKAVKTFYTKNIISAVATPCGFLVFRNCWFLNLKFTAVNDNPYILKFFKTFRKLFLNLFSAWPWDQKR